jgi:adenylate kinase family enzyme
MARRNFDEVVEEETTVTEEVVEETPDLHEKFVTLLVEMGLSAEQAEAVHSMAMDLIDAGDVEIKEEVKEEIKVEASRQRGRRSKFSARKGRTELSEAQVNERRQRRALSRLRRQNIELREQLRELGASPAAAPLRNAPNVKEEKFSATKSMDKHTAQALEMINNYK